MFLLLGGLLFQRNQKAVGNFHANYFFLAAVYKAVFHVNGRSGIRSEGPAGGELDFGLTISRKSFNSTVSGVPIGYR